MADYREMAIKEAIGFWYAYPPETAEFYCRGEVKENPTEPVAKFVEARASELALLEQRNELLAMLRRMHDQESCLPEVCSACALLDRYKVGF